MEDEFHEDDFSDGRSTGDYNSKIGKEFWPQIAMEAFYLGFVLFCGLFILLSLALRATDAETGMSTISWIGNFDIQFRDSHAPWLGLFISGVIGASVFSLKWLYHTTAKCTWHRDRVLWRIFVPWVGGVVALFIGLLLISGLLPLFESSLLDRTLTASGFGFLIGIFADGVLAALEKMARRLFGTLNEPRSN